MKIRLAVITALLFFTGLCWALAEDADSQNPAAAIPQANNDALTQWVWGEVVSVDAQNKELTLKYLDYEADQEKEISLTADETTNFENVKSLDEVQPKDNLSVDYIAKDGKNIAKNISLERAESAASGVKSAGQEGAQKPAVTAAQAEATDVKKPEAPVQSNQ